MKDDIRYIELIKACGLYGNDHLGDMLELCYQVAADERSCVGRIKRGWVGLTDEEIDYLEDAIDPAMYRVFARRIEAKLKEKNHG
jgi:hypothetical protein